MMHMNNNYSPFYTTPWPKKKKVVSIPVHFVESEITTNNNKNNPAIQIQKVWRGFLVRKNMRKIKGISVELERIEEKLCDFVTKELIKREQKERLKVSESIMNLLLKLDSVRVFNYYSGVRDYRKSVIKKAIVLQELVDQIHMVGSNHHNNNNLDEVRFNTRDSHLMQVETQNEKFADEEENGSRLVGPEDDILVGPEDDILVGPEEDRQVGPEEDRQVGPEEDRQVGPEENGSRLVGPEEDRLVKSREDRLVESREDNDEGVEEDNMVEEVEENCLVKIEEEDSNENKKKKMMLERMVEENERMMVMMAQLFERNEMQTKILSSLSQRVEQLERAYTCDKLRRKKKKRNGDIKHK